MKFPIISSLKRVAKHNVIVLVCSHTINRRDLFRKTAKCQYREQPRRGSRGDAHATTLTWTRGSTASSTRSESSALSFCTRPLIIKSIEVDFIYNFSYHLCVSSATYQVAMLDVKVYNHDGQGRRYFAGACYSTAFSREFTLCQFGRMLSKVCNDRTKYRSVAKMKCHSCIMKIILYNYVIYLCLLTYFRET